jgi:predicted ATP-dependent serine protease
MTEIENMKHISKGIEKEKERIIPPNRAEELLELYPIKSLKKLMTTKFDPVHWVVDKLVPESGIVAISGAPASFKTWVILDMAQKIAKGEMLFDRFETRQSGVLLIDEENGDRLLQMRFKQLQSELDLPVYTLSYTEFKLNGNTVKKIIRTSKKYKVGVVIFDSLVRIHGMDENSATEMANVFSLLRRITKEGITVIFTHHHRKSGNRQSSSSQEMRGSSDILASLDSHISIEREAGGNFIVVTQNKSRYEKEIGSFKLKVPEEEGAWRFEMDGDIEATQSKTNMLKELILEALTESSKPMIQKELFELVKQKGAPQGESTFRKVIDSMWGDKKIQKDKGPKHTTLYFIKKDELSDESGKKVLPI